MSHNPNSRFPYAGNPLYRSRYRRDAVPAKKPASDAGSNINKPLSHNNGLSTPMAETFNHYTSPNHQTRDVPPAPQLSQEIMQAIMAQQKARMERYALLPINTRQDTDETEARHPDIPDAGNSTTLDPLHVPVAYDEHSFATTRIQSRSANKLSTPSVHQPDNYLASTQIEGAEIRTETVIESVNEAAETSAQSDEVQIEGVISCESAASISLDDGTAETAASSTDAGSLQTPAACDAHSTAPEALQAEVAPQTFDERSKADLNLLKLKRPPSVTAPLDPLFRAGYVSCTELEHSRWTAYFIHTPQVRKLIAIAVKAALGTSAWDSHVQQVKMLQRTCTLEDEQGCYNVINDKHLEFPCAWFKVELCPVWPLKNGGELSFENFWVVPDVIYSKNHQTLPAAVDQNKPGISRLHKARTSMPGQRISEKTFIKRCLQDKGVNHVLEFIRQGMPLVNGAPIIDREPPVVERPVLGLLYRECKRHQPFNRYCQGLEHLNLLFAEQSGILEATALVCFDAVTMGNPDNIMDTLLQMATDTYLTAQTEEARQAGKDALAARVRNWLYETFQLDILHAPQKFEKKLYARMFSHPPVHLHW